MNVGEFFVTLGVDADTLKVKDFARGIGEIPLKAAAAIAALAGVTLGIKEIAQEAMGAAVAFQSFEAQTGLSSQELQHWQNIGLQANVTAETMSGSISSLNRQLADIRLGKGNIAPFQILGVNPTGNAFQVLDRIRDRIKGMDRGTATNLISQMGLSPEMMSVLTLSDQKFKEFSKTVVEMSPKQQETFLKLRLELTRLKIELQAIFYRVLSSILPILLPFIHTVLPALASFLEHVVSALQGVVGMMMEFPKSVTVAIAAIGLLTGALTPMMLMLTSLLLILEDLYVWKTGGKSLFGDVFGAYKKPTKADQDKEKKLTDEQFNSPMGRGLRALLGLGPNGESPDEMRAKKTHFDPGTFVSHTENRPVHTETHNHVHVNTEVHGTAPAKEMADHVNKHVAGIVTDAISQMGNQDGAPQ